MKKSMIKKFLALALAVGVISTNSITTVFASTLSDTNAVAHSTTGKVSLSGTDKETLNNWMKQYDVNDITRKSLLEKLENGQLWDSITSNSAIKTETLDKNTTKKTYADGSISIIDIDNNSKNDMISLDSIREGYVTSGSGYQNHRTSRISEDKGLLTAKFSADYTFVYGGDDYIEDVYDEKVTGVGSISNISLKIVRATEGNGKYASAKLSFESDFFGYASGNCYVELLVGGDSASTSSSF